MGTNQDEMEIDLWELCNVLWSKIHYVILSALALGFLAILVSKLLITPQYESTTKMYVLAKQDNGTITSGDLQASSQLTKDYAELIKSRQVTETVISELNLDLKHEGLLGKMTVSTPTDLRVITISVKDKDPYQARLIADAIRDAAAIHIQNVMNTEAVNVVDKANIPESPVSPNSRKNGLMGAFAGAVLAVAVILFIYLTNDTIQTAEDVERYLGVSALGVIPLSEGQKRSRKRSKTGKRSRNSRR